MGFNSAFKGLIVRGSAKSKI